jgi:hypothetical protein
MNGCQSQTPTSHNLTLLVAENNSEQARFDYLHRQHSRWSQIHGEHREHAWKRGSVEGHVNANNINGHHRAVVSSFVSNECK